MPSHDFRFGESGDSEDCTWCGVSREHSGKFMCSADTAPTRVAAPLKDVPRSFHTHEEAGLKFDSGKLPLDLLPFRALESVAEVLQYGAGKYAPHNWRKGFKWSRLLAALLRHTFAWASGKRKDPETGYSHLAHAAAMLLFLLAHEVEALGEDDVPKA